MGVVLPLVQYGYRTSWLPPEYLVQRGVPLNDVFMWFRFVTWCADGGDCCFSGVATVALAASSMALTAGK